MVDLYLANINNISLTEKYLSRVTPSRREKIDRLIHEADKLRSLTAGLLINEFFPGREPQKGPCGKLFFESDRAFNLSHSGDYVILAISDAGQIGCDIEQIRELDYMKVGRVVFTESELDYIAEGRSAERFFDLWTKKESFIKCIGEGFRFAPSGIDVLKRDSVEYGGTTYFFKKYMLGDYVIMLCCEENNFPAALKEKFF